MTFYDYINLDEQSALPIYQQLISGLERFCGDNPAGTAIPSEREICLRLGVSRTALRHALQECVDRKLLIKKWAKGIFVADKNAQKRILVMMPDASGISMPWNYTMPGIEQRAGELSVIVEKISTTFLRSQTKEQIERFLMQENFTGILHMDYLSWHEAEELAVLRKIHTPVLFPHSCRRWAVKEPFPMTIVDERRAFQDAVAALVKMGHTKIATLSSDSPYDMVRGYSPEEYLAMLEEIGADSDPDFLETVKYEEEAIAGAVERFLSRKKKFTAVICFSDFYAIMAMKALKKHSLNVPEDVSIMGFCGFPGGQFLDPGLSTIDFHYFQIGRNAVDRILTIPAEWRNMPDSERIKISPHELILRKSVRQIIKSSKKGT